jgi:hypothetical protein
MIADLGITARIAHARTRGKAQRPFLNVPRAYAREFPSASSAYARKRRVFRVHEKGTGSAGAVVIPIFSESIKRGYGALSSRHFFRHRARTRGPAACARASRLGFRHQYARTREAARHG